VAAIYDMLARGQVDATLELLDERFSVSMHAPAAVDGPFATVAGHFEGKEVCCAATLARETYSVGYRE
jgi:hypothetical protein